MPSGVIDMVGSRGISGCGCAVKSAFKCSASCLGAPGGSDRKESACSVGDLGLIPVSGRSSRRKWQPTPVFLPGESHGHGSCNTTERLHFHFMNR